MLVCMLSDKVDFLVVLLSIKGNMQDELVDAKGTNRPEDATFQEQNIPEVCFSFIKYILVVPFS